MAVLNVLSFGRENLHERITLGTTHDGIVTSTSLGGHVIDGSLSTNECRQYGIPGASAFASVDIS